jgi:Flp pilus assembly protein TadG
MLIRSPLRLARDQSGSAIVEMAYVVPVFVVLTMGGMDLSLILHRYAVLTEATRAGARQLSIARVSATPYTDTISQIQGTAVSLTPANITSTVKINGVTCATDAACKTAMAGARGQTATLSTSYPCTAVTKIVPLPNSCVLAVTFAERVE